jgi:uncharacterized membrane protein YdbT with pleckstrin-like domain
MAYYTKILLPDEQVRAVGRLHWAIYIRAWLLLLLGGAAALAAVYYRNAGAETGQSAYESLPIGLAAVSAVLLVLGVVALLGAWARQSTTEIVVTDRRIIFKSGFVRRRTMEMNMNKVETVDVVQSIGGRMFNFGTILIRGTGSTYEPLDMVADPLAVRTAIIAQ